MTAEPENEGVWEPDPRFPTDPEFYRRTLHFMPTPIVVVDTSGTIVYVNEAMLRVGGWELDPDADRSILSYVHPDDQEWLTAAFLEIVQSPGARVLGSGRSWSEIYFQIVAADGTYIPIELVGNGGVFDPAVGGIIYEARPAHNNWLLERVLEGLSRGDSLHQLLSFIAEMIASPPLDLDAAFLHSTDGSDFVTVASSSPALGEIVSQRAGDVLWSHSHEDPSFVPPENRPPEIAALLSAAGYEDLWHLKVESPLASDTLRIVFAARSHHVPWIGPKNRMERARKIASAVLLRTQADVLLEFAAGHDQLTGLPNRAKFHQTVESITPMAARGVVQIVVDNLKSVNFSMGQFAGDAALQIFADRIRVACHESYAVGRTAGSEFSILLRPIDEEGSIRDDTVRLARELLESLTEPIVVAGRNVAFDVSIGIATAGEGISTDHLLTWADAAMHDARRAGGGRICRYGASFGGPAASE